jgi:hypothetical protein
MDHYPYDWFPLGNSDIPKSDCNRNLNQFKCASTQQQSTPAKCV